MALITEKVHQTAERLEELSDVQRTRVMAYVAKERIILDAKSPVDHHFARTINETMREYRHTLIELQKLRFELGIDEFKGPLSQTMLRGMSQTTHLPDGSTVQKQIYEAINTIEQIFDARQIPRDTR